VIEEYARLASETHDTLEQDFAGILPNPDARLELQNTYQQEEVLEAKSFGDLVGQSAALRHMVGQIDVVAPTEASGTERMT
jgi:transcriptional regulator with GAF, ATPase, and Fis domain